MEIVTVGLDCQRAPVEVREQLSFSNHRLAEAYNMLAALPLIGETAILSTCNRVEIYALSQHATQGDTFAELRRFLSRFHNVSEDLFSPYLVYFSGRAACQHLFEVASGIKSMVIGEAQIQGQVRDTLEAAHAHSGAGRVMDALFRAALSTGKRARSETAIGASGVSVSFTAVQLLEQKLGSLVDKKALVIGSGKTGRLTGQILVQHGIRELTFVNRNLARAYETAESVGFGKTRVLPFEELQTALAEADVVVSCTAAPHTVVKRDHLENRETSQPLYLVDIAVPRDIEPDVRQLDGVEAWDIDDIKRLTEANLARRTAEVGHVQDIVQEELNVFMAWLGTLTVVPTIKALRNQAEMIRKAELERTLNAFGPLGVREQRLLEELSSRIVNKLLHEPTLHLKEMAAGNDASRYAEAVTYLFGLQGVTNESYKEASRWDAGQQACPVADRLASSPLA